MHDYFRTRFPAFQYPNFRTYWIGQLLSNIGTEMFVVGVNWHIYTLTKSAFALGLIGLIRFLAVFGFSLLGGLYADSHDRRKIMLVTQSTLAVLSFILGVATWLGLVHAFLIYVISALTFAVFAFDAPARQSFVPNLVDRKHLMNALSLTILLKQTAIIAGPTIAGFMIAWVGLTSIYLVNTASFLALIMALWMIHVRVEEGVVKPEVSFHAILEGLRFVKQKPILWSTMILDFFSTFFSSATALLPIFAQDVLRVGPQGLGLLYAAPAAGSVVTSLIIAHFHNIRNQGKLILAGVTMYAVATIGFGLSRIFPLSLACLALVGAGDIISTVFRQTIRQSETPDTLRGRMTAVNMLFVMGGPQLGEFEAGLLAGLWGASTSVVIGGVGKLVVVGLVAVFLPVVRLYQA